MQMMLVVPLGEREGICGVISNPYELYSFTPAFEQAINDGDNDVSDGDNDETAVLVLRQPPDNCQWTSGENSDSPQPGNLRPISHKINISNFADARLHAAGRLKSFLLDIFGSAHPGRQTQLCSNLSPVCTIVKCKITITEFECNKYE